MVEERKREGGRNARTRNRNWRLAESARVIRRKGDVSRLGAREAISMHPARKWAHKRACAWRVRKGPGYAVSLHNPLVFPLRGIWRRPCKSDFSILLFDIYVYAYIYYMHISPRAEADSAMREGGE